MAVQNVELREKLRNDAGFRARFMDEVLLQLAADAGLISDDGEFLDPEANLQQSPIDARIAGRPVIHYYGLSLEQVENMGLSQEEIEQLSQYVTLESNPNLNFDPTAAANGPLKMHPGAVMWTPPPPLSPEDQSSQNPSGQVAAETANTPAAVAQDAVIQGADKPKNTPKSTPPVEDPK